MKDEARQMAIRLKALASENRLRILCELIEAPQTVSALQTRIAGISQSALSQHLAVLKAHGMVTDQKNGQNVTYSIADPRVEAVIAVIRSQYCMPETDEKILKEKKP